MIRLKQAFCFRAISGILIFFFLVQMKGLPVTVIELEEQFKRSIENYENKNYEDAKVRLERLAAVYEAIKGQTAEMKKKYGQVNLLLGACYERTGNSFKAEQYYEIGFRDLLVDNFIIETDKDYLPIYKKVSKAFIKERKHKKEK